MFAVRSVTQGYEETEETNEILEAFPWMVNECIRIGIDSNTTSRFSLHRLAYRRIRQDFSCWFAYSAIARANVCLRNYRKGKSRRPYSSRPHARLIAVDCKVEGNVLRIPFKVGKFIRIPLNAHTRKVLAESSLKLVMVGLTANTVSISYRKEVAETKTTGYMGIDRNLDNVTIATGEETRRIDLSEATRIKDEYRFVKSHLTRNDVRIRKKVFGKYGRLQSNKVSAMLHRASREIVTTAKVRNAAIVMENLTGLRKLYRKRNGQGNKYRSRLNSWSFYELQVQIRYKAESEGIPVYYVPAAKTSSICATCGERIIECTGRKVYCPQCKTETDRDENAARNIARKGALRFGADGQGSEAMKGNAKAEATPQSRFLEVHSGVSS